MPSRTIRLSVGLAALLLALPAFAGKVYQWKDAKGVTHYSDSPPPAQLGAKNRVLKDSVPASTVAAVKPTEEDDCAIALKNLERLKSSSGPVGFDANGDGKLDKEMSADERAQQVQKSEWMLTTRCNKPTAKP
jgi:hypothetical protein